MTIEQDRIDAARWRALIGCGRMHFMGCANFDLNQIVPDPGNRKMENLRAAVQPDAPYLHFGMEFWSQYRDDVPLEASRFERELVTTFVDHIIAQAGGVPAPERFTRLPDEKLAGMFSEELQGLVAQSFKPVVEMPELAEQAALQAMRRVARYADHLRGVMKMLADNADLDGLIYKVRDSEQLGWDGPRVKAAGEAIAEIKSELAAGPNDG